MNRWNSLIEAYKKKDKIFSRFVESGDYRDLNRAQAKYFVGWLVEYGSRKNWQPVIRKVLEYYAKKFPVENVEETKPREETPTHPAQSESQTP